MRKKLPILVGGTGQFVHAVLENWHIPAQRPNHQMRESLEKWAAEIGNMALHNRLAVLDPEAAASIDPANLRRTIRAMEVILLSGQKFSEQKIRGKRIYDTLTIGLTLPRNVLYQLIDTRIDLMMTSGFLEEVQNLTAKGYSPDLPAFPLLDTDN